ncbi:MAG: hypothetical protein Q9M94_04270 [Candidatus Gracilibacteria bacterium]|nr:hypothetical protein [Candidatus Gracilibacteria bacterium]MDQ7022182.1 hypothetical protein [Candidatus Gracilibacteria bacterium]
MKKIVISLIIFILLIFGGYVFYKIKVNDCNPYIKGLCSYYCDNLSDEEIDLGVSCMIRP